jgi:hypothetical protein
MSGWEFYEPPETKADTPQKSGKWLFTVLAAILFVNILVIEMALI